MLVVSFQVAMYGQKNPDTYYSPQQLQEDVNIFKTALETVHPALDVYLPKDSFDLYMDLLNTAVSDSLTRRAFSRLLLSTARKLRCSHTQISYSTSLGARLVRLIKTNKSSYLPVTIFQEENSVLVKDFKPDGSGEVIGKLLTINGMPTQVLLDSLGQYFPADGFTDTRPHFYQYHLNNWYDGIIMDKQQDSVELILEKLNETDTIRLVSSQVARSTVLPSPSMDTTWQWQAVSKQKAFRKETLTLWYNDTLSRTALLDIAAFRKDKKGKLLAAIFEQLQKDSVEHLIIDLQRNLGGDIQSSTLLLQYLMPDSFFFRVDKVNNDATALEKYVETNKKTYNDQQYTKFRKYVQKFAAISYLDGRLGVTLKPIDNNHFNGRITVLISGQSFSASAMVASYLKDRENTITVGQETGGGAVMTSGGRYMTVKLPHSEVNVNIPIYKLEWDVKNGTLGKGVQPDIEVVSTLNDQYQHQNNALEKAVRIAQQKLKDDNNSRSILEEK